MELAPGELAVRRPRQNGPDADREEMYMHSVRRCNAQRDEQRWWERLRAAEDRIRAHTATFSALIAHHEREASRCRLALGLTLGLREDESKGDAA